VSTTLTAVTPEQYLAAERKAEYKSEYINGEVLPMPGASMNHVEISGQASADLRYALADRDCRVFHSDLKVHANANGSYCYPDVGVVCGEPRFVDGEHDTLLNPIVIIAVLSPSTQTNDRGDKFEAYQGIESLRQYLLLDSRRVHAELFTRQPDGKWLYTSAKRLEDTVELESIGCRLELARLYKRVDFSR
jgi:Uma2 family endonuclease